MRFSIVAMKDDKSTLFEESVKLIREEFPESPLRHDFGPPAPDMLLVIGDGHFFP